MSINFCESSLHQGFIQRGGGTPWDFPPLAKIPPPLEILKINDVITKYMTFLLKNVYNLIILLV